MSTLTEREQEAVAAFKAYVAQRARCVAGEAPWSTIAAWFTDDAVFIDPVWGRVEGREQIATFFDWSMRGLEGWAFPEEWTTADGDRVVSFWWNQLPGERPDGSPYRVPSFSVSHYAGDGLFDYELDVLNFNEVVEVIGESGWRPGPGLAHSDEKPNRDVTPRRLPSP